jgi:hypothetical protein
MALNEMWCSEANKELTLCKLPFTVMMLTYLLPFTFILAVALLALYAGSPKLRYQRSKTIMAVFLAVMTVRRCRRRRARIFLLRIQTVYICVLRVIPCMCF